MVVNTLGPVPRKIDKERTAFVERHVELCLLFLEELCGVNLYSYQKQIAHRVFFSLIAGDAEEITVVAARQSGKSEALACTAATAMVILPQLAKIYPEDPVLKKFKNGVLVGVFGPIDEQADTIYGRLVQRMQSEQAKSVLVDPDIDDFFKEGNRVSELKKSHSLARKQTCHPQANIESKTYHLIIIDEAQDADATKVTKSIHPMRVATAGTIIKVGTPAAYKSEFYEAIQRNKMRPKTNSQPNHLEFNWRRAAKENPDYAQTIQLELDLGKGDTDEFILSYEVRWLLERGMFVTDEQINALGDQTMKLIPFWSQTPIVMGVDIARRHDSTVLTAVFVDWDHPDEFGLYPHRVLNWKEIHGEDWEKQYAEMVEFVNRYYTMRIAVDGQGMGGPVAERMQVLLPNIEVISCPMNPVHQTERWKHLIQLIQRGQLRWPAHKDVRRTQVYRRFVQQISTVEKEYRGAYLLVSAPSSEKSAHDDYIDSLALACSMTMDFKQNMEVETWSVNPFLERGTRRGMALR